MLFEIDNKSLTHRPDCWGHRGIAREIAAILGRDACYSGKVVKWDDLLANGKNLCPGIDDWDWDTQPPAVKDPVTGAYDIAKAGENNPFEEKAG